MTVPLRSLYSSHRNNSTDLQSNLKEWLCDENTGVKWFNNINAQHLLNQLLKQWSLSKPPEYIRKPLGTKNCHKMG